MADSKSTQRVRGRAKEVVGKATDDDALTSEGKADEIKAKVRGVGEDVKDAVEDVGKTLKR